MTTPCSTRERLIESAQRLLWDVGFEAMSPRMVIADSGVGQGSLYHHFKGKKDLAHAALDRLAQDLVLRAADCLCQPQTTALSRIDGWLTLPRNALKGCRMGRLTPEHAVTDAEIHAPIARYFATVQDMLAQTISEAQAEEALDSALDPQTLAQTLIAVVQGGYVLSRAHLDPKALGDAIAGMRALLGLGQIPSA